MTSTAKLQHDCGQSQALDGCDQWTLRGERAVDQTDSTATERANNVHTGARLISLEGRTYAYAIVAALQHMH